MKILLVVPSPRAVYRKFRIAETVPHLGLLYLASVLRENDNVKIIDLQLKNLENYKKFLKIFDPDVVGFTATTPEINEAAVLAKIVKKNNKDIITILGGAHVSALPRDTLKEFKDFDVGIIGEGEKTIQELISGLKNYKDRSNLEFLKKVSGLVYRRDETLIFTGHRPLIEDLDKIPFPSFDLIKLKKYSFPFLKKRPYAPLITSRGCPYSCTFCSKSIFGRKIRFRSIENVIVEIEYLYSIGVREIQISDDTFNIDSKRAIDICNKIIETNLDISLSCPVGFRVDRDNAELFKVMKRTGFYLVALGAESGSQGVLNQIKKDIRISETKQSVEDAKRLGIQTLCYFIIGLPSEKEGDIVKTIKFAKDIDSDYAKFSLFTPLPGSELFGTLERDNKILHKNWEKYNMYSEPVFKHDHLTFNQIQSFQKKAFREFYLRPMFLIKKLRDVDLKNLKAEISGFREILKFSL